MKHLLIIALSFIVFESQAQNKRAVKDSVITAKSYTWTGKPPMTLLTYAATATAMTISHPDSSGKISVYINRKRIKWTSDSTFTISPE